MNFATMEFPLFCLLVLVVGSVNCLILPKTRISEGEINYNYHYPYQALLEITTSWEKRFCNGAIIGDRYVLTESTCMDKAHPIQITVKVGGNSKYGLYSYAVEEIHIDGELSILKIQKFFDFMESKRQYPVEMNQEQAFYSGTDNCTLCSWDDRTKNQTTEPNEPGYYYVCTNVYLKDFKSCNSHISTTVSKNNLLCTDNTLLQLTIGDRGCPVVCENRLVGVALSTNNYGGQVTYYNVATAEKWIHSVVNGGFSNLVDIKFIITMFILVIFSYNYNK